MKRVLVVIAGPDAPRTFDMEDGQTLVIGRGQASDTQINDPRISRVHCRVAVDGGKTMLLHAGSTGGTFIGNDRIDQRELQPGDVFRLGDTQVRYQLDVPRDDATVAGDEAFGRPKPLPEIAPLQDLIGQSLAHYRIDEIITQSNSGMIFRGTDTNNQQKVAIKVLTPDIANSDEQRERFVRAMKTMMPIKHENIIQILSAGKTGPYCWAAMEYVDGESLTEVIERIGIEGMLDWREVWRVAVHIGRALSEAYDQKIIHRNVTPTNIIRRKSDRVCLLGDLMLAKALEGTLAKQVTQPGQLIGDVPYMSPERTRDQAGVDGRSDLYGLGSTCYALLTGKPPFESNSLPQLIQMVRDAEPQPPKDYQLSVNDAFQDVVIKLLAKRPEDRFQNPAELLRDLERIAKYNGLEADWSGWSG